MKRVTRLTRFAAVLVAAMAILGVGATTAFANYYAKGPAPVTLEGVTTTGAVIATAVGTLKCTFVDFRGEMSAIDEAEIELHPEYNGCNGFGFGFPATVKTTGCNFRFGEVEDSPGELRSYRAPVSLGCEAGHEIEIVATGGACVVKFGSQTPASPYFELTNSSSNVRLLSHLEGIEYSYTGLCGSGTGEHATYDETALLKGFTQGGVSQAIGIKYQ
jgi:hypothetical protein